MRTLLLLTMFLLTPAVASAEERITWSFEKSAVPGRWEVTGFTSAVPTEEGLHIQTTKEGRMFRLSEFPFPVEAAILRVQTKSTVEGNFMWHAKGAPPGDAVQLPFLILGNGEDEIVRLALTNYPQWDPATDRVGVEFPAGTDILLKDIEFYRWNLTEKITMAFQSFWTMDGFRPYSINFLWGPRTVLNPIQNKKIFKSLPPTGWSAFRSFYIFLILAAVVLMTLQYARPHLLRGHSPLVLFLIITGAIWFLVDIRMGAEIIRYASDDYKTSIAVEPGKRQFRERAGFQDFVEAAMPFIQQREKYLFMSGQRWPFFGAIRYLTYPSIPMDPNESASELDTVIVFERPDIRVNEKGELMFEDEILSQPGDVLLQFDEQSFVFRIRPSSDQ
ncbi:MAG: hypothetical protein AAB489_05315 [Patescibacteria group bacterium]